MIENVIEDVNSFHLALNREVVFSLKPGPLRLLIRLIELNDWIKLNVGEIFHFFERDLEFNSSLMYKDLKVLECKGYISIDKEGVHITSKVSQKISKGREMGISKKTGLLKDISNVDL